LINFFLKKNERRKLLKIKEKDIKRGEKKRKKETQPKVFY